MVPENDLHDLKSLSRAVRGGTLDPERLAVKAYEMGSAACHRAVMPPAVQTLNLEQLEQVAVREALNQAGSVVSAAKLLGIGKTTLYRKLRGYGFKFRTDVVCCPNCGRPFPRFAAPPSTQITASRSEIFH